MTSERAPRPVRVSPLPNGEVGVVWDDDHESYYGGHALRCACACATCVDEMTGARLLEEDRVPREVRALEILPVGNYGVSIRWSDGHDTGIYTFARLRRLCRCADCS